MDGLGARRRQANVVLRADETTPYRGRTIGSRRYAEALGRLAAAADASILECEALAEALLARDSIGKLGIPLGAVATFWTASGSRYDVISRWPSLTVVRRSRGGPMRSFVDVEVQPSDVVVGAPLVLLGRDRDGSRAILCFTGIVTEVVRR